MTFENCCSGLFNFAPTGCARTFAKVGLNFCNTCNPVYGSNPCPVDTSQGSTTCDECCTNVDAFSYAVCQSGPPPLPPNPPYSNPISYNCESGTPDYAMSAIWRNGEARNVCATLGGHDWILDAMPAASIYNQPLAIPGGMYMAPNNFASTNTSKFFSTQQGNDTCGLPCERGYGNDTACPQPCGRQDCGFPTLTSSYTLPP
jgi:hypothetical protein